jgi:hypothetical protein
MIRERFLAQGFAHHHPFSSGNGQPLLQVRSFRLFECVEDLDNLFHSKP